MNELSHNENELTAGEEKEVADIEMKLLLEAVFRRSGYDFRDYAPSTMRRRIRDLLENEKILSISQLQDRVLRHPDEMEKLLYQLSVHVTSMFRDPGFYKIVRKRIVPFLKTYPFIRIWLAGCSTGEEVFSLAILLREEGIYERCRIYATDLNGAVIKKAREGIFKLDKMKENSRNYIESGGQTSFSDYYTVFSDLVRFDPSLVKNVVFAQHNLTSDNRFNEFNLIFCRNVTIYFNRTLQQRVHSLFYESLCHFGFLCLGAKESLKFTPYEECYKQLEDDQKIFQKTR